MSVNFELPELGEGIEEADVLKVLVAPGDAINEEDPIIEIETEKATVEVPAPHAGSISAVLVAAGDTIKVGQAIVAIESDGSQTSTSATQQPVQENIEAPNIPEPTNEPQNTNSDSSIPAGTSNFELPELGEGIEEADVLKVLVAPGDAINCLLYTSDAADE